MMISNSYLLIFAVAFMGCVLATPIVTRIAIWAGAIDRPDQFRRIHKGATPRLGGLGLAFGIGVAVLLVGVGGYLNDWDAASRQEWWNTQRYVLVASLIVLMVGFVDDTRAMGPRMKLLGQACAVLFLFFGGIRIQRFDTLGLSIDLGGPVLDLSVGQFGLQIPLASLLVTMFWFLACMNIWNLIDGMDGLASGVGLLVSGTLTLVAIHVDNVGVAILAAALAGSLAGFLLYNWHPACIFLGDSGSLLIGLLIGIIGVQGSLKGPSTISILFPILAMGLPISDTAMAIFRRWVRNLPLSAADRRHVHHLLIGLGLNPRQAVLLLYCFAGFLCGAVLLGVSLRNEMLALVLGLSGCLAFLIILTSRMDEFKNLQGDFKARIVRGRQERAAAKLTWEAIQRIELTEDLFAIRKLLQETAQELGCSLERISCTRDGSEVFNDIEPYQGGIPSPTSAAAVAGPSAVFRLSSGTDLLLTVALHQDSDSATAADIAFRFLQRLSLATAERIERLLIAREETSQDRGDEPSELSEQPSSDSFSSGTRQSSQVTPVLSIAPSPSLTRLSLGWLRMTLGWSERSVVRHPTLGDK